MDERYLRLENRRPSRCQNQTCSRIKSSGRKVRISRVKEVAEKELCIPLCPTLSEVLSPSPPKTSLQGGTSVANFPLYPCVERSWSIGAMWRLGFFFIIWIYIWTWILCHYFIWCFFVWLAECRLQLCGPSRLLYSLWELVWGKGDGFWDLQLLTWQLPMGFCHCTKNTKACYINISTSNN